MEYLPRIVDPAYLLPKIPCYCKPDDYDRRGMADFPQRVGWRIDRQDGPVRFDESRSQLVSPMALLQAWLFFGSLQDIFSIGHTEIDLHLFQQQVDGQSFLSTAALKECLTKLERVAWQFEHGLEACLQRQKQVHECFRSLCNFRGRHWDTWNPDLGWNIASIMSLDQIMVFVILGETLRNAVTQIWLVPTDESPMSRVSFYSRRNSFRDRFLQSGWCPNEAFMLYRMFDNTGLFFATMLKRPFSNKLSHKSCSDERCLALHTSDDNYETRHVDSCSNCREIEIDQEMICKILKDGGTPVVHVQTTKDGEFAKVRIGDYNVGCLEYIAISHVWAHGLGNPKRNALPLCQVMRLHSLVGKLSFSMAIKPQLSVFWIDTLCVPVDPELESFRKLAISRLDDNFRNARKVLVLDADLQRCSVRSSNMELATKIVCCGWMRRLWTLAEAVVAKDEANARKVHIQFSEGPKPFNAVAGRDILSIYHTEHVLHSIFSAIPQFGTSLTSYTFLVKALSYRGTSRLEDEPICLASILGFDSKQIALITRANTAEERTHLMYTLIDQIPASILFNRFKKLSKGFRWAPASLMGTVERGFERADLDPGKKAGKSDSQGLHVQYSGFVAMKSSPSSRISTRRLWGQRYVGDSSEAAPTWIISGGGSGTTLESGLQYDIERENFFKEVPTLGLIVNPDNSFFSALVSVIREEGDIIYATYEGLVSISSSQEWNDIPYDWKEHLIDVREVPSTQKWCID